MLFGESMRRSRRPTARYFPPFLSFNSASLVACLVQAILLLNTSQSAGVTHWKLIDNEIMPESTNLDTPGDMQKEGGSLTESNVYTISQNDPEFSTLVRYSARQPGGGGVASPNRGGGSYGIFNRQGSPHILSDSPCHGGSPKCAEDSSKAKEGEERDGGTRGEHKVETVVSLPPPPPRQPRNPDGSGPM